MPGALGSLTVSAAIGGAAFDESVKVHRATIVAEIGIPVQIDGAGRVAKTGTACIGVKQVGEV